MLKKSQAKFIFYFIITFVVLFALLYSIGLIPESIKPNQGDSLRTLWDKAQPKTADQPADQNAVAAENPTRIVIDKIGVDVSISNPNTTNVTTLDEYLKQGAVRYPGSGLLGSGNMFIFAHSAEAYVILHNMNLKAFNKLEDLKERVEQHLSYLPSSHFHDPWEEDHCYGDIYHHGWYYDFKHIKHTI